MSRLGSGNAVVNGFLNHDIDGLAGNLECRFVVTLELEHERVKQSAWRFVCLAVLAILFIIPASAQSTAPQTGGAAFCTMSPASAVPQTIHAERLNPVDRNSPDDTDMGCCQCLACGAILKNDFNLMHAYERKTNAHVPPDSDQFSRDGPQGPFRPPRI